MALETLFTKSKFKINQSLYFTQRFLDCIFSEPVCTTLDIGRVGNVSEAWQINFTSQKKNS